MQAERMVGISSAGWPEQGRATRRAGLGWLVGGLPWLALWSLIGMALRLWHFGWFPLREDEALYGFWARLIMSGQDPMLEWAAVDKPPFFIYTLANFFTWFGATVETGRGLSLLCSFLSMILLWALARRIYGPKTARWALAFFALSPFAIAFAPTMYTDSMLAAWLLLSLLAASWGFGLGAGLALGMAFATKQNALLFIPLIAAAVILGSPPNFVLRRFPASLRRRLPASLLRLLSASIGFYYICFKVWQWDGWRILPAHIPSFWDQSWNSYGGLDWVSPLAWEQRMAEWGEVWQWMGGWLPGTVVLMMLVGLVVWRVTDNIQHSTFNIQHPTVNTQHPTPWDILFLLFTLAYSLLHIAFSFQAWDRYLLGLAPLLALLAARGAVFGWSRMAGRPKLRWGLALIVAITMWWGAMQAATARIPVGGDHGGYAGIEQVADYLRENVPAERGVIYQRWLGWHWNWYLWDSPAGRVYWADPDMLLSDLSLDPAGYTRFVVFPGWQPSERETLAEALADVDLRLAERLHVYHPEHGRSQFVVYEIVAGDQ